MNKLDINKLLPADLGSIKIEIKINNPKENSENQILPVYINNILRVYEVKFDEEKLLILLEELKEKYSDVKNESFNSFIFAGSPQFNDIDGIFEGEANKEIMDYHIKKQPKIEPKSMFSVFVGNRYQDIDAMVRYFPRLYIIIKKALKTKKLSLSELNKYLNNYKNNYYNGMQYIKPNKNELQITAEDIKHIMSKLYSCFKFERVEYLDLTDNRILLDKSIEEIIELKEKIDLGKINGEIIGNPEFVNLLKAEGFSRVNKQI